MNKRRLKGQQFAALFVAGWLLFNYPLLSLFSHANTIWGIPLLYFYVFTSWAALIVLMALIIEHQR